MKTTSWILVGLMSIGIGCDDGTTASDPRGDIQVSNMPEAGAPDGPAPDVEVDGSILPDAQVDMACQWMAPTPTIDGPLAELVPSHRGVDQWELPTWQRASAALLADPGVHFVATWRAESQTYVILGGPVEQRARVVMQRLVGDDHTHRLEVLEGRVADIFPRTETTLLGDYEDLLMAFENPTTLDLQDLGYAVDDPRVGFLPLERQSFPRAIERLVTLFDSPDAPDFVYGVWPWAGQGTGTHGGIGLLQSRATLILSGAGVKTGVVIDDAAALVDIAPTVLAALGAPTTDGRGPDAVYANGLYLKRQDGRVLEEALTTMACGRPKHVVILLFDGLNATELNHDVFAAEPPVPLPALAALAQTGTVYRHGAVAGFPSFSAPGHTTVGTGLWPGHHGVLGNSYFGRAEQARVTPFDLLENLPYFIQNPAEAMALYDRLVAGDIENLAQAAHRAFGPWNPATREGAFVAVINELTFKDADFSTLSFFSGEGVPKALFEYRIADNLAMTQFDVLMSDEDKPVPTILQMSFLATDAAGESDGPHSPLLRDVLAEIDERVAQVVEAYRSRGALDDTLFVLTSDHGMALQDRNRRTDPRAVLRGENIKMSFFGGGLVYLRTMDATVTPDEASPSLRVSVRNHDNGDPVSGARVSCDGCLDSAESDGEGATSIEISGDPAVVQIRIEHPQFNPHVITFERP